jgi:tellurite resistance protein
MSRASLLSAVLALCCALAPITQAVAQERLNRDVQRLWDDTFDVHRDHDRARWERRREAERREWCRDHRDYDRCGPYFR